MVRGRRDEAHPRRGVAHLGDPGPHLVAGQLAALTGLGALGHLDLDVVGLDEVLAGDAEPARGRLLDGAAAVVAVGVAHVAARVLPALAGVRLASDAVHGDGQGLVRLGGDGAVGHGAGGEALHDLPNRLHLLQGDRLAALGAQPEQAPQGSQVLGLLVDGLRVRPEDVEATLPGGVLQLEDRLGVEEVVLPLATPLVLAAEFEVAVRPLDLVGGVGQAMAQLHLPGQVRVADAAEPADGAGEAVHDEPVSQTHRLEDLCPHVGPHRGDAHLREDLQDPLVAGLDVVAVRLVHVAVGAEAVGALREEVGDGFQRQVRVDGRGPVTQQQAHVMHLAGVAGLHDQPHLGALALAHEMLVDGPDGQQGRHRGQGLVAEAIGQHHEVHTGVDGLADLHPDPVEGAAQAGAALGHRVEALDDGGPERRVHVLDVDEAGQLLVGQHGVVDEDLPAGLRPGVQQVALRSEPAVDRGDDLLPDGVQWRVGHLGEQLLEVVEQHPRALRQHGHRGVGAHGPERLLAVPGHRGDEDPQLLVGVAEGQLAPPQQWLGGAARGGDRRQVRQADLVLLQP